MEQQDFDDPVEKLKVKFAGTSEWTVDAWTTFLAKGGGCVEVSEFMIRLLRHDESVPREDDGAVRFDALAELFKSRLDGTSQWTVHAWIFFSKSRRTEEKVSMLLEP